MKNSARIQAQQKKLSRKLGLEIQRSLERYTELKEHGGSDPFYADGANMNLCRNHVIYFRKRIEAELDPEYYPAEYSWEIPEKVNNNYMANSDQIRRRAERTLEVLKNNKDFQYLQEKVGSLLEKEIKQWRYTNPACYVLGIEDAIRRNDLIAMRRCGNPEYYIRFLRESREKLEELLKSEEIQEEDLKPQPREGQLTIWDFIGEKI